MKEAIIAIIIAGVVIYGCWLFYRLRSELAEGFRELFNFSRWKQ